MDLTRRQTMMLGLGTAIAAALPQGAMADMDAIADAIKEFTGGAEVATGGVEIGARGVAANGTPVPARRPEARAGSLTWVPGTLGSRPWLDNSA